MMKLFTEYTQGSLLLSNLEPPALPGMRKSTPGARSLTD